MSHKSRCKDSTFRVKKRTFSAIFFQNITLFLHSFLWIHLMTQNTTQKETHFYTIGISYKKADADMRGLFSLDQEHQERILSLAQEEGMEGLAIISTCNRTELYGFAQHPFQLIQKLCAHSKATLEDFEKVRLKTLKK